MSLGPLYKKEEIKVSKFAILGAKLKKTGQEFFQKPTYYLFYLMLAITIIGLFCGMSFAWPYYLILISLLAHQLYLNKDEIHARGGEKPKRRRKA